MTKLDFSLMMIMNFILGSSYMVGKLGMGYFAPFFLYFLRFFISGTVAICFNKFPKQDIKLIFLSAFFIAIRFLSLALGIKYIDSSTTSIILRLDVAFTIILSIFFLKEKITSNIIFSVILSLLGLYIIKGGISISNYKYFFIVIIGALASAMINIISKKIHNSTNKQITAWSSFFASIMLFIISLIIEKTFILKPINNYKPILMVLYFSIFSTYTSYHIMHFLLRKYPVSKIVPYDFSRIIISIILGVLILNESITFSKIIGTILIVSGIFISQINISFLKKNEAKS